MPDKKKESPKAGEQRPFAEPKTRDQTTVPPPAPEGNLPAAGGTKTPPVGSAGSGSGSSARAPDLKRADPNDTRAKTSQIGTTDDMRDMLSRMRDIDTSGEIDDAEAARRAGMTPSTVDDEPVIPNLPAEINRDLATVNRDLDAGGQVVPEWHTIATLPGYMQKAIRAMGRGNFSMFTRTALEDIVTMANVNGQGPNSDRELKAVAGWLMQNAEDLGEVDIDYSQIMPGYTPKVREFRTENTRFHVVQDKFGKYIYAYPEEDAVDHSAQSALGHDEDERDEFGAKIKKLSKESRNMKQFKSISEEMRYFASRLEQVQTQQLTEQLNREILESYLFESTLSKMIGDTPGGQQLVRFLHRKHKLSNDAQYDEHPFSERVMWTEFKNHPDNFLIVSGQTGVAGIKPNAEDIRRGYERKGNSYNPARDNTLRYVVVAFKKEGQVNPELLRNPEEDADAVRDVDPTIMPARGGVPSRGDVRNPNNIFDRISAQIGRIQAMYIARGAIEHGKIKSREERKKPLVITDAQIAEKFKPIFAKLVNQTLGRIQPQIGRLSSAGNFDQVDKLIKAAKRLQALKTALDVENPNWSQAYNNPLNDFLRVLKSSINELTNTMSKEEEAAFRYAVTHGQAKELGELLDTVRGKLMRIYEISTY